MKIDHTRNGLPTQYDEEPEIFYMCDKNKIETLNIVVKILDVDGNLLSFIDIYNETVTNANIIRTLKMLAEELYLTIIDELPILHGYVTEVNSNQFTINIGNEYKIKKNMQVVVYEHEDHIKDSNILGYARIVSVKEKFSDANTTVSYAPITPTHMIMGAFQKRGHFLSPERAVHTSPGQRPG